MGERHGHEIKPFCRLKKNQQETFRLSAPGKHLLQVISTDRLPRTKLKAVSENFDISLPAGDRSGRENIDVTQEVLRCLFHAAFAFAAIAL